MNSDKDTNNTIHFSVMNTNKTIHFGVNLFLSLPSMTPKVILYILI